MREGNPLSFLHVVRAEIDLPEGTDLYNPAVYQKAGENLRSLIAGGKMAQDLQALLLPLSPHHGRAVPDGPSDAGGLRGIRRTEDQDP